MQRETATSLTFREADLVVASETRSVVSRGSVWDRGTFASLCQRTGLSQDRLFRKAADVLNQRRRRQGRQVWGRH